MSIIELMILLNAICLILYYKFLLFILQIEFVRKMIVT